MSSINRIVIVGAGLAGARAAEALRKEGYEGTITLLGEEPERPYLRSASGSMPNHISASLPASNRTTFTMP